VTAGLTTLAVVLLSVVPASLPGMKGPVPATLQARPLGGTCLASWHPYRLGDRWTRPWGTVMVCAHRRYAKGTRLLVSRGDRRVIVTVADWGPARWTGREIDLSHEAFACLADPGIGEIEVEWREQ